MGRDDRFGVCVSQQTNIFHFSRAVCPNSSHDSQVELDALKLIIRKLGLQYKMFTYAWKH